MPTTGLATFEQPLSFVTGYGLVEQPLLDAAVVEVVLDDLRAESVACNRSRSERIDRLPERRWEPLRPRLVRVPFERRRQLEPLVEPMQARGDHRGERKVRIHVTAGKPSLDALPVAVTDDAEAARAVVMTPGECRRRPRAGAVALVRVDVRGEEERELARARDLAGEETSEGLVVEPEEVRAVPPERPMDVARVADPRVVRLGHERDRAAVQVRYLLGAVLVDRVTVGGRQRVGEAEVDLVLPGPGLALRAFDWYAGGLHAVADLADQRLVVGGREHVVVEDVRDR